MISPVTKKKAPSKWDRAEFVAWDGEGAAIKGRHRYIMLRNSLGTGVTNAKGLSTEACLDALADGLRDRPKAWHIGFAFGYDVNMILRDLPRPLIKRVHQGKWVAFGRFVVRYRARKQFTVRRIEPDDSWTSGTIWDVFGFFQSSMVTACEQYDVGSPHVRDGILDMKVRRSLFTVTEITTIQSYCHAECELLVALAVKLHGYLRDAGLALKRFDGAGAVAASLMLREKVKEKKSIPPALVEAAGFEPVPSAVLDAVQYAFFGGRIEAVQFGHQPKTEIHHYDINSAYPNALQRLPCLAHGRWLHRLPGPGDFGMVRVRWHADPFANRLNPFPWRARDGRILYPASGEGWYWTPEVFNLHLPSASRCEQGRNQLDRAVPQLFSEQQTYSDDRNRPRRRSLPVDGWVGHVAHLEGWTWEPLCTHQPFAFIPTIYQQRREWKAAGRGAEKVLKLGLNSLYGKTAQHIGGSADAGPAWHQLEWAGYTTSVTRAMLFEAAWPAAQRNDLIFVATDGIYASSPLDVPVGNALGEWDYQRHSGLTVVQSGVYWVDDGRDVQAFHRGFDGGSIPRTKVVDAWKAGQASIRCTSTRFWGMGQALAGGASWPKWQQWVKTPRVLQLTPAGTKRWPMPASLKERWAPWRRLCRTLPYLLEAEYPQGVPLSTPTALPWRALDGPTEAPTIDHDDSEDAYL